MDLYRKEHICPESVHVKWSRTRVGTVSNLLKVPWSTWSKMHEFPQMFTFQNIQTLAHLIVSKYHGLPVLIRE